MKRIHCLGVLVLDALSGPLESYPVPRERVQSVTKSIRFAAGGGAANTAGALARMGLPACVFSKVGHDLAGDFLCRELQRLGVNVGGIRVSVADTTPFTFVGIHTNGDRTFIHTPGANLTFNPEDFEVEQLLTTDFLLYQDLWVLPKLDGKPGAALLAEARNRGVVTLLDECWGLGPDRTTFEQMLPHCDYVLPSLDDMRAIYPDRSAQAIATTILDLGANTVVLKMGAAGCLVAQGSQRTAVEALPAEVVDTTGAGDCWNAGFISGLVHGEDIVTSARIGAACAAYGIGAIGGSSGVPEYAAVMRRAARRQITATPKG
ncbi:MAG: sugar kinase [Pirellulales bacterium]|nr:sugar kinase [Pirellulales bacterium]